MNNMSKLYAQQKWPAASIYPDISLQS